MPTTLCHGSNLFGLQALKPTTAFGIPTSIIEKPVGSENSPPTKPEAGVTRVRATHPHGLNGAVIKDEDPMDSNQQADSTKSIVGPGPSPVSLKADLFVAAGRPQVA